MFLNNIFGGAQTTLFRRLYRMYENGLTLLLHSPSIRSHVIKVLCNPRVRVCTNEHALVSEVEFDKEIYIEIRHHIALDPRGPNECIKYIHTIEQLVRSPLTQYHKVVLQKLTSHILRSTAFSLHNMHTHIDSNKQLYIADKICFHILKLAAKFGFASDTLYFAMYIYKTLRFIEALSVVDMTKVKLAQPCLFYNEGFVDNKEKYTEAVGGQSLSSKMRQAVAGDIRLINGFFYFQELMPEQKSSKQANWDTLYIPPFILLHMLDFLCSRHVETMRTQRALEDLHVLVHHAQRRVIAEELQDIS